MPPATNNTAHREDEKYTEDIEDVYTTFENFREFEFLAIDEPNALLDKENVRKEKQISVDPVSLKGTSLKVGSSRLLLPPVITGPRVSGMYPPLPLPSPKPKFISSSLPNSATSSPRFSSTQSKKKWRNQNPASPRQVNTLGPQRCSSHSIIALQRGSRVWRSKSCGQGRTCAPSDEFDLCINNNLYGIEQEENGHSGNFSKAEADKDGQRIGKNMDPCDEGFKCGALCLFLPGLGKGKPVKARKETVEMENVISRTVSLEKFECGSWSSSAILNDEDGESMNLYFDLPVELIRSSINDAHSPVSSAFVFDKDRKGVLKTSTARSTARKSHESSRHVRFSTSTPTSYPASPSSCITPRLRKAREQFNAFLEAQSA